MAVRLTCQCGMVLQVPAESKDKQVGCPRCQAVLSTPVLDYAAPALNLPPSAVGIPPREIAAGKPTRHRKTGRKPRRNKGRAKRLDRVNLGLGFHYASPFVVLASIMTGCVGIALLLASQHANLANLALPVRFFLISSNICLLLAGLLDVPTAIFCLAVPDGSTRGWFLGSFGLRLAALTLAVLSLVFPEADLLLTALALIVQLASWVVWVIGLWRLAVGLNLPDLAAPSLETLRSGLFTLAGGLVVLFGAVLVLLLIASLKGFSRILVASFALFGFGGAIKTLVILREGNSFIGFFLAPTGVPFIFRYYDLIGSLRTVIARRG